MRTSSSPPLRRYVILAAALVGVFAAATPSVLYAGNYTGYGDTGFSHTNKGRCCEDAIFIAQDNSAADCERAGGVPDFRRSAARGRCNWETTSGRDGRRVYRCSATSSVYCR